MAGGTALLVCAQGAGRGSEGVVQKLIDARCNPCHRGTTGGNALTGASTNENSVHTIMRILVEAGIDVNYQITPQSSKWKWIYHIAVWAVWCGSKSAVLREIASWPKCTALMMAAKKGKVQEVQALLAMRADTTLRNRQGRTALEITRSEFGGEVPYLLEDILTRGMNMRSSIDMHLSITMPSTRSVDHLVCLPQRDEEEDEGDSPAHVSDDVSDAIHVHQTVGRVYFWDW